MKKFNIKNKTFEWPKTKKEYITLLSLADEAYYNTEHPLFDDYIYDQLRDEFKNKFPDDPFNSKVGSPSKSSFKKENHKIMMGSQAKITKQEELDLWIKNVLKNKSQDFIWSIKLDGLSVSVDYEDNTFSKALTRGNGVQGENISVNVLKMKNLPFHVNESRPFSVRGEIMLNKESFHKFFSEKSNPRNVASGLVRRLDGEGCEHLQVFFYDIVFHEEKENQFSTEEEKFLFIESLGFKTPSWGKIKLKNITSHWEKYNKEKNILDLEMDGLIFTVNQLSLQKELGFVDNRPKFSRAYKFSSESGISSIKDITWQVGRSGRITPVAEIEPIHLAGATLTRVSLHNLDEIKKLNIKTNQKIEVVRSGDVIPKITKTLSDGDIVHIPSNCPSCDSLLKKSENQTFLFCKNQNCPEIIIQKTIYLIQCLEIDGFGEELVKALFKSNKIKKPTDIFDLKKEDISSLERQGEKSAQNVISAIVEKKKMTSIKFLAALGIPNLAEETAKLLIKEFKTVEEVLTKSADDFLQIKGIGDKTSQSFPLYFKENIEIIKEFLEKIELKDNKKSNKKTSLTEKTFCFTGFRDKELESQIEELGGIIIKSATKSLDFLVCLDKNSGSSKIKKARANGSQILDKEDLLKKIRENEN